MIYIDEKALEGLYEDALLSFPFECCGFLLGVEEGNKRSIKSIKRVTNLSEEDQRRRFSISATDYLQAEKQAEENNLLLLGIYHSHPDHPAVPSETDRLSALPYFSYVIISVMNNKISHTRSWRLNENNQFEEEHSNLIISTSIIIKN